jgi:glycine dehydrogenase subunit 1
MDPERLAVARTYAGAPELAGHIELTSVAQSRTTGQIDRDDLQAKLSEEVAAVYFENPSYLGLIESEAADIAQMARNTGTETIVGVDPISLGVLSAPGSYGADIAIGSTQPLGVHMNGGGGAGGFIATRDEESYARQYPTLQISITDTVVPGERAFGLLLFEQSSYGSRENANDWTGNSVYLWAIANAVYMSLMGPQGFADIGQTIIQRSHYAANRINEIDGVEVIWDRGFFKEFVVRFEGADRSVAEINRALLDHGIFGGKDLSQEFPDLGKAALYCVTEVHTVEDLDRLAEAIAQVISP